MTDTQWYAIWLDPRSRSRRSKVAKMADCGANFFLVTEETERELLLVKM